MPALEVMLNSAPRNTEILVVDQGSTDGTLEAVESLARDNPVLRVLLCPVRSLNVKRNHGYLESQSDVVAFTDDDCLPDPGWMANIVERFGPTPHAIGTGRVLPLSPGFRASLRPETRPRVFTRYSLARLWAWRCGSGNNLFLKKSRLADLGILVQGVPFDPEIGAGSTYGLSADDTELLHRCLARAGTIQYVPEALVYHAQSADPELHLGRRYRNAHGYAALVRTRLASDPAAWTSLALRVAHSSGRAVFGLLTLRISAYRAALSELRGSWAGLRHPRTGLPA